MAQTQITGDWEGKLSLPTGSLRIVFHIEQTDAGALSATLDSPDQGATGIPVASASFDDNTLTLDVTVIAGKYVGTLSGDGQKLSGTWSQGGGSLPLDMEKTDQQTELNRPQEPQEPYPYDEAEVFFDNKEDGVKLAGTLTTPLTAGPHPAVILISGSGPQDRDESLMGHKPFLVLADHLTRQGIAVLRYDDRGTAGSTGDFSKATSEDFAGDARAAVAYLKKRTGIDPSAVGAVGHSEGGLIAPMLAASDDNVAFIVMMAGPGLPGVEILKMQSALMAKTGGMSDEMVEKMAYVNGKLYETAMNAGKGEVETQLKNTIAEIKEELPAGTATALGLTPEREPQIIQQLSSPWFQYFLSYDPRPVLGKVQVPVLSIIGEKDLQVPAEANTKAIKKALNSANNTRYKAEILPGLNHLFQTAKTGSVTEYAQIEETFAPNALNLISDWILIQTQKGR